MVKVLRGIRRSIIGECALRYEEGKSSRDQSRWQSMLSCSRLLHDEGGIVKPEQVRMLVTQLTRST